MSYGILRQNGQDMYNVKEFIVDTYDEITEINTSIVAPGSTCFVIDTSEYYMLNTEDEWIKVNLYGDLESIKTEIQGNLDEVSAVMGSA